MVWNNLLCSIGVLFVLLILFVWPANVEADCSQAYGKAFINEFNTKSGFVEVYFKPGVPEGNYRVEVCNEDGCNDQIFYFDGSSLWVYHELSNIDNNDNFDITLYDFDGDVVDYINVHISQGEGQGADERSFYNIDYKDCDSIRDSISNDENSPHLIERNNSGQRQFYRTTDGGGSWEETNQNSNNTYGESNHGADPPSLHHVRLEHDGAGLTCMAETVTIRACADADCTEAYTGEVTVDLTSPASGWSPDPVTFSGGFTTVELRHTTAETVTLGASASLPLADSPTLCVNNGGGAACELVFAEVGVLIDGDDSDAAPESAIVTQIAGKPSNVAPPNPALRQRVRIVRTDDQTGACVAGVGNKILTTSFQYLVPTPVEGLDDNTITVTGNTSADLASAGNGATVELAFDGNGTAPFNFTATDAGRYRLRIDLDIPVTDAAGDPTGETSPASNTSNSFVVRPLALFADAAGNPQAQDAADDAYQQAGMAFSQTFTSLRWTAGRDGDNDGLWDDCGDSTLVDPGSPLARVPTWNIGQPTAALILPTAGNNPGLSYASGDVSFDAADESVTVNDIAYPEVGIVQLHENVSGGFLGEPVGICSPYIGRFYPDHFAVTIIPSPPTFTDACIAGNYSYLGEPFPFATPPIITISAMNGALSPAITRNYDCGGFWKFAPSMDLAYSYTDSSGNSLNLIPAANTVNPLVADTMDCSGFVQLTLTDTLTYARPAITNPLAPFPASVDLTINATQLTDNDSVCYDTGSGCQGFSQGAITGTTLRHGVIQVFNNFGPETMDITHSPFAAHYYDGTNWVTNTEDACSTALAFCSSPPTGRVITVSPDPLEAGQGTFTVTTAGTFGEIIDVCLTAPAWLSETDCTAPGPTCGAFTFGIYRGNDRIINWREIVR